MSTTLFEDLLKTKPDVPTWQDINPGQVQRDTISGNIASFSQAKSLAQQYNQFQQNQVLQQLRTAVPEFAPLQAQMAQNLAAQLRGELTASQVAASQRTSAAGALGLGLAGTPAGAAYTARNLGLDQFKLQQSAQAQTPQWLQTVAGLTRSPIYDFSSVFLSPVQRFQMQLENQTAAWNVNWLKNQVAAQPSGWAWALAKQGDEDIEMAKQAAISYFSGGMGGGMGGGGGGGIGAAAASGAAGGAAMGALY